MTSPTPALIAPAHSSALAFMLESLPKYLRQYLPQDQIKTIDLYGGEFDHEEIEQLSFDCPAIFVTCLGFDTAEHLTRKPSSNYGKAARLGCFVVTKNATREGRFIEAADLVERVAVLIQAWKPQCPEVVSTSGQPTPQICVQGADARSFKAENLFERKIDKHKLAIWMVSWWQGFKPLHGIDPALLPDLLAVELDSTVGVNPSNANTSSPVTLNMSACVNAGNPPN